VNNIAQNCNYNFIELNDNLDDILIEGNTVFSLLLTSNGVIHQGELPTTTAHITVANNTFYIAKNGGMNLFGYSVADALTDYAVQGNTVIYDNAIQLLDWRGLNLNLQNNLFLINSGSIGSTNAISFILAGKVRADGNIFQNLTTTNQAVIASTTDIVFGPSNTFTQYFYNGNINTAAPTTNYWTQGTVIFNVGAAASGTVGWVCTSSGTPGTWKTFGAIAA
jgi:hypothetical protein